MKGELGQQIMKNFDGLRAKHIAVWKIAMMKIKKSKRHEKVCYEKKT